MICFPGQCSDASNLNNVKLESVLNQIEEVFQFWFWDADDDAVASDVDVCADPYD